MTLLDVKEVHTSYGLSQVLFGISLSIGKGEIVALLGRNGVGKTTTLRTIMGLTPAKSGRVSWRGRDITRLAPFRIARLGIGYIPEDRRIFPELTVWENLDVARRGAVAAGGLGWNEDAIYELFPALKNIRGRRGGYLSGGEQQMLTIARTLMGNPSLLLLDEPSEGLAPLVVEALRQRIALLRDRGLAIVLAEQNLDFVLSISNRVHILEKGVVKFSGVPEEVRGNNELLRRLLRV